MLLEFSSALGVRYSAMASSSSAVQSVYDFLNDGVQRTLLAFSAITWYNVVELVLLVFVVFKEYKGLYFWSLLVTTVSLVPYQAGAWINLLDSHDVVGVALLNSGWLFMIIGQSVVLWSRLHLVTPNTRVLNTLLAIICFDSFVLCIPTTVLTYGSNLKAKQSPSWITGYAAMEKIQMTIFAIQEITISLTYLYYIQQILRRASSDRDKRTKALMKELIAVNFFLIAMDGALVGVEYATFSDTQFYSVETNLKGVVYSVKLKLEFAVLSRLIRTIKDSATVRHAVAAIVGDQHVDVIPLGPVPAAHLKKPSSQPKDNAQQWQQTPSLLWGGAVVHNELAIIEEEVPTSMAHDASMFPPLSYDTTTWGTECAQRESWNAVTYPGRIDGKLY